MFTDVYFLALISLAVSTGAASTHTPLHDTIALVDFQRILRTGLDNELVKVSDGVLSNDDTQPIQQHYVELSDQRNIHSKRKSNMRRRISSQEDEAQQPHDISPYSTQHLWNDLVHHAWSTAETISRIEHGGLIKPDTVVETHPCPFLVCTQSIPEDKHHNSGNNDYQNILASFNKGGEESLLIKSAHNETCIILTTTAKAALDGVNSYHGNQHIHVLPLVDIMKISAGTVDEVSSGGWAVPFIEKAEDEEPVDKSVVNVTQTLNQWERLIIVDFTPGLGGMKEEAELLDVVNNMMGDIQDMGEVGWIRQLAQDELKYYRVDETLKDVPSLSEMFSLTAILENKKGTSEINARINFWRESLLNGIESEHACSEMFSTLFVKPRAGYYSFDLILNPNDGPPPRDYESSASNPACVISLIAALSIHPDVLSVKANFPISHGWNVARKIDSYV
eukprot:g1398.t1 g1398   contig10:2010238-2011587(+)